MPDPGNFRKVRRFASLPCFVLLPGSILLLSGCGRSPAPAAAPQTPATAILAEPAQLELLAGAEAQVSAQANDAAGQPIGGAKFRFSVTDAKVLRVSDRGLVTSLGPVSSRSQVTIASGAAEVNVPVVVQPGLPQRSELLGGDGQSLRAGEAPVEPLEARFLDGWGNAIPQLTVVLESTTPGVPSNEVVSDADGLVRFEAAEITRAGDVVVTAHPKGLSTPVATFTLHVTPGPPAEIRLVPGPSAATPADDSSVSVTLRVSDSYDNPVPGVDLQATLAKSKMAPLLARTDANGAAVFSLPQPSGLQGATIDAQLVETPSMRASFVIRNSPK